MTNQYDEPGMSRSMQVKEDAVAYETMRALCGSFFLSLFCVDWSTTSLACHSVQEVAKVHEHLCYTAPYHTTAL